VNDAEIERKETVERYPLEGWSGMALRDYAIGQEDVPEPLGRWIEFQTPHMGSMRGGSARKHIIYKHRDKPGWHFPSQYDDEQQAWEAVRSGFVEAFKLAGEGRWTEIDEIEALGPGAALLLKLLYAYFPDEILPICSRDHLRRFLEIAGDEEASKNQSLGPVQLNRALLVALRRVPELAELPPKALERFLYRRFSPFEPELYKIAPGEKAKYWDECLAGNFICCGWEKIGDLRQFDSKESFMEAYHRAYDEESGRAKATEKGKELWRLMEIQEGHLIAANAGTRQILAVGKVMEPGYVYDESQPEYKHTLPIEWDTSYAQEIPQQRRWAFVTIGPIQGELRTRILSKGERVSGTIAAEALFEQIVESLDRRGQAILYGPPGTGKTWNADRFARWWLRERNGEDAAAHDGGGPPSRLEWVTFHPSYSYEDFVEGFRPTRRDDGVVIDLQDGIFKVLCEKAAKDPDHTYLLVIDEINRANIAKVFGELITLVEKDKRGRLAATLPYSKQEFVVPANLFVLGTMNTADRSIRLLDTALRRRFGFVELMPRTDVLEGGSVEGLPLDQFLAHLNARIVELVGREKQIGHSFFLDNEQPITDAAQFARIFKQELVPLLQEYSLDDYDTLAGLLGERIVNRDAKQLNTELLNTPEALLEALEEIYGQRDDTAE
jgi:5-methylcytosine-specific restriction protein B